MPPDTDYDALAARLAQRGTDLVAVEARLREQRIETPSWGYAAAGTRFGAFPGAGLPRDVYEKIDDAAEVHRLTGVAGAVALHIPWDAVDDYGSLRDHLQSSGLEAGAINPNLFQDPEYKLGSVASPDPAVRRRATDHLLECAAIARTLDSSAISIWLADGTSYAGQDDFLARRERMLGCLGELSEAAQDLELLVEYKLYEPAFYATELADWGSALLTCQRLGAHARVLVDLGHHAAAVNIEQIVALLAAEDRLGGFHFNNRRYGDDDLIVGSVNPFELFCIFAELARSAAPVRLTIDQAFVVEHPLEGMLMSVCNLQEAYAKALLIDRTALGEAQAAGDVVGAHAVLRDAYAIDVRPLCAKVRDDLGAAPDPLGAFRAGGYAARAADERPPRERVRTGGLGA
jgi:L-rhamnose isomerase/sugar isomerase